METPDDRSDGGLNTPPPPGSDQVDFWRSQAVFWRNRAASLFDHVPLPMAFCDAQGTILTANLAMAAEWGTFAGRLVGRPALSLFRPITRLDPVVEALRLRRRARYPVEVSWCPAAGVERRGAMTVDVVIGNGPDAPLNLLLTVHTIEEPATPPTSRTEVPAQASDIETRILALVAAGGTSTWIAAEVGLTADGVNYHLARLSRRWGVANRTALVARAYVHGILSPQAWPPAPAAAEAGREPADPPR
ncbi:LuxR C-terminal-related transcriptional regulator [Peterkaempfera sp. SMS 1(5)a]|uniref:helix-turn-helix transcriptional regulator n=1 Tax=Peterkaempfera podocarpi TaxID=3232308 RepID=UPI00366CE709